MQFAYKAKNSTTLCTIVYLEALHHCVTLINVSTSDY